MACSIIRNKQTNEVERVLAPNGKDSNLYKEILKVISDKGAALRAWAQVYTPSFKAWFGDWENDPAKASKAVDENGEPLLVYHGTGNKFNEFDKELRGTTTGKSTTGEFDSENAFFFTTNPNVAFNYAIMARQEELATIARSLQVITSSLSWDKNRAQDVYNNLRKSSPKFATYIDGLKAQGLSREQITDKLKVLYEKYRELDKKYGGGGALSNPRRYYNDVAEDVSKLRANRNNILNNKIYDSSGFKYGTIRTSTDKNGFLSVLEDGRIILDEKEFPKITSLKDRNIKTLSSEEFDKLIDEFNRTVSEGRDRVEKGIKEGGFTPELMPVFLNAKNVDRKDFKGEPFVMQQDGRGAADEASKMVLAALKSGKDGVVLENITDPEIGNNYAVFEPNQIKSVFNQGTFSETTGNIYQQTEERPMSAASKETLNKVKEAAKKMGISIQDLTTYAKQHPEIDTKSVNGVADLVRGVIAVAVGKEDVALTEEMVHIATAILEKTNPEAVTAMISKIDRFKIYKKTLEEYKGRKQYQLPNGKPDIRKIKKEAVDKLIAELIVNEGKDADNYPELLQEENVSFIERLWRTILDYIRGAYSSTNIDIFKSTSEAIIQGDVGGTVKDIASEEIYLQVAPNPVVDGIYNTVVEKDKKLKLIPASDTEKRHYEYDGVVVAKTVTEKVDEGKSLPERTPAQKLTDKQKAEWGTEGHSYVERYISAALIDENGYARKNPLNVSITTKLNDTARNALENFSKALISSYPEGTRFLLEKKVVNEKVKGLMASTVDFMAIIPTEKKDGSVDAQVDVLDWKFIGLDKERYSDIPWYNQKDWKVQMGEYTKIAYNYGVKPNQIRRARMIPFVMNYSYRIPGDKESGLVPSSIEIGNVQNLKESALYLLPVPLNSESTGNPEIDRLVSSLQAYYEKLYTKSVSNEEWLNKKEELNDLSAAIRTLRITLDFKPISEVATTFLINASKKLASFEKLDYKSLTPEEINNMLSVLLEYKKSGEKFSDLDKVFISQFPKENLSGESLELLRKLEHVSASVEQMMEKIIQYQRDFTVQLALKEELTTMEQEASDQSSILAAEKEISVFDRTFLEASRLSARIIQLGQRLISVSRSATSQKFSKMMDEFGTLLINLEREASARGKTAFEMIGGVENGNISLIKKLDRQFMRDLWKAKQDKNKKFILDNIDKKRYRELVDEQIKKAETEFSEKTFSEDPEEDEVQRKYRLEKLKNEIDIERGGFYGYNTYLFNKIIKKSLIEENILSKEYREMRKSEASLKMWNFFTNLNQRAIEMGYLKKKGTSFFPLIEATMIERLSKSSNVFTETADFFKDMYTVRTEEELNYAKVDPETQQVRKEIPKYFTRTDRNVEQLSTDLNKVGALWINAILNYERARDLEYKLLTLHSVEEAKGRIVVDQAGNVVFEGGAPKVDYSQNKNADILETIVDDDIYGIRESVSSMGNVGIGTFAQKVTKNDENKEKLTLSTKKTLENSNTLLRSLALGLKLTVAIPNYLGVNIQSFINSGNFYTFSEFEKRNLQITTGIGLSTVDKGLIDMIVPLNEDVTLEKRRQLAKKQGYIKYLNTWRFSDVMMSTMSYPERKLQIANALAFNDNSMVVDGRIVNIRQYVKQQDRKVKYQMSNSERKSLEKTFEKRVQELKNEKSLSKIAKIENDRVVVPGVTDEEMGRYRLKVVDYMRNLNGQMSIDDKANFSRDTLMRSFMMFKTWIPKQVEVRAIDIYYNANQGDWEYGRTRLFMKTWIQVCNWNLGKMREIITGSEEGIRLMNEMLETKKQEYYKKTGKVLTITDEEFYDLVRRQLSNQTKELGALFGLLALLVAAKLAAPDDDEEDAGVKNRYKYLAKIINKTTDELAFYYNPLSFEGVTRGSILPTVGLLSRVGRALGHIGMETLGQIKNDEEMIDENYPIKYTLDLIPGTSQFNREILPLIYPDLAKELGIRTTAEARLAR